MREDFKTIPLVKNETQKRFELEVDGHFAFINYGEYGNQIALVHTEVPEALRGRGVAAVLVEKTLNYLEGQGNSLLPFCPYVFAYIKKHPEWKRIVNPKFKGYDKL
ncbi:N-acetyltransferase [Meridianimaribacter sp. CL38]|uniref:GNAT family N-acetyltransferase n=1 Tax=Meridianimaribacter sp. CL38 TaxID=2213021 RepID=UPI00103E1B40|nr:GNAT family N-acetyltransferase [Meridianimaribacter sp. CL38]TBV26850.1 N-acetyltransferase [Meridianimaribacter sp. CL38]